jgi:two-component system chemotaxis sensor kinase CheA
MPGQPNACQRFVVEAREHLARMTSAIMALERGDEGYADHLEELLRATHSLKGGAGFSGLSKVERLAHSMETAVENIRDGSTAPTHDVVDVLLFALDRVGALVDDAEHSEGADISEPLERLRPITTANVRSSVAQLRTTAPQQIATKTAAPIVRLAAAPAEFPISERVLDPRKPHAGFLYGIKLDWFQCERGFDLPPLEVARRLERAGVVLDSRMELSGPTLLEDLPHPPLWYWAVVSSPLGPDQFAQQLDVPCAAIVRLESVVNGPRAQAAAAATRPRPATSPGSLRIPVNLIDRMMGLAGELVLVRNQATHATDLANAPARQLMRRLDAITNELQDAALRMRMQPVGTLFDRFPRVVRDVARQLGKQIDLEISGAEVELDKTIIELLADPLMHLVRNCCDHGIETPDQRVRAGKPPGGLIRLSARQERGQIVIEIRDNGRGLDREAIRRKALQQGVKRGEELDRLSERQLYDLILLSGFSTAAQVTELSGRGVGMDVVRTNLEQVGGVVEIDSAPGSGTVFSLRLPLTLAIMPCLLLQSGDERFVLPQRDVEEIVFLDPANRPARIESSNDEEVLRLRGRLLPVARLRETLGRRHPVDTATRVEIVQRYQNTNSSPEPCYVIVLKIGSHRFGLVVDGVLGGAEIVVKPLHTLLRPLGVYGGATILGDGGVALILSGEGIARHSGVAYRTYPEMELLPNAETSDAQALLLFRYGATELLATPLSAVRRVVMIARDRIQQLGDCEMVDVDGAAINVLRLDRFLGVSACPDGASLFLILPRNTAAPVGLLASEIVDTPTQSLNLDEQAYRADGVLGTAMIRGQIAMFLDIDRVVGMWQLARESPRPALPGSSGKRILLVEDTRFFRQLVASYLESDGYEVLTACNGSEGLALLATTAIDLVVSDIEMPEMDGLSLARRLRQIPTFERLPLLALTSLGSEAARAASRAAGFDAHDVKLDRGRFLAAVRELLTRGRAVSIVPGAASHV